MDNKKKCKHEVFFSNSAEITKNFGKNFGKILKKGDIVFLNGNLGAGKTTLVQGVFNGLGIAGFARSSSFIFVNEYQGYNIKLYHIDLYRLENVEIEDIGIEEYLYGDGVCIIEWADKLKNSDIKPSWGINLSWQDENIRKIEIFRK